MIEFCSQFLEENQFMEVPLFIVLILGIVNIEFLMGYIQWQRQLLKSGWAGVMGYTGTLMSLIVNS